MGLLDETIKRIIPADQGYSREIARERLDQLTMPHWALGRLMDLALDLAAMTRSTKPEVDQRVVVVMAGDHGVADGRCQQLSPGSNSPDGLQFSQRRSRNKRHISRQRIACNGCRHGGRDAIWGRFQTRPGSFPSASGLEPATLRQARP